VPIYDYACSNCGKTTEVIHGINDSGPRFCPECGAEGTMRKALSRPAIVFKGSGWAKVDRRSSSGSSSSRASKSRASEDSSAATGSDGGVASGSTGSTGTASSGSTSTGAAAPGTGGASGSGSGGSSAGKDD
jgi:putative FmdB family regulatory protein